MQICVRHFESSPKLRLKEETEPGGLRRVEKAMDNNLVFWQDWDLNRKRFCREDKVSTDKTAN